MKLSERKRRFQDPGARMRRLMKKAAIV